MQITKFKIVFITILLFLIAQAVHVRGHNRELPSIMEIDTLVAYTSDSTSTPSIDLIKVDNLDSLNTTGLDSTSIASTDSIDIAGIDSLSISDSLGVVSDSIEVFSPRELKRMIRDSIRDVKDSIRWAKPRVLDTYAIPDSMQYRRLTTWTSNTYFNEITLTKPDTTFYDWYTEYPFLKEDINTTYLGVIGSATQNFNYFKRADFEIAPYFTPYITYSYTPDNLPFYNTKSAYTELAYWGTMFAYKDKEEANIRFLHTQNITPALNVNFLYQKFGGMGFLRNEESDSRTLTLSANYLGKRYLLNSGIIHNKVYRQENGGVQESGAITDTTGIDLKTVEVNLQEASNQLERNTFFINQSYRIPIWLKKATETDTISVQSTNTDSTSVQNTAPDSTYVVQERTTAYIGHYGEISKSSKKYLDNISSSDQIGRDFYDNKFYINPTISSDSISTFSIENRVFLRLQPWTSDAIVSNIDGGIGYQYLQYYNFQPNSFLSGNKNINQNNLYFYAGASGKFRKYFSWEGFGKYNFAGYAQNDFNLDAKATVSFYPFKDKNEGIHLSGKFSTSLKRPDWYANSYYSNHYVWNNDFSKISKTKIEGELDIPKWKLSAFAGYSLIGNNIYHDTLGIIRQNTDVINVLSIYLKKNIKIWYFHLDHKILFQASSDQESLPLPMLSTNFRYYIQFDVVKNVMTVQLGAEATYNTSYYAPAYNPALGVFQSQNKEKIGNNPYIDVFANFQWKEVTLFLKLTNAAQGWPSGDSFSAYQYVKPQRGFKIGLYWPFYVK